MSCISWCLANHSLMVRKTKRMLLTYLFSLSAEPRLIHEVKSETMKVLTDALA